MASPKLKLTTETKAKKKKVNDYRSIGTVALDMPMISALAR